MKKNNLNQAIKLSSLVLLSLAVVGSFSGCATIVGKSAPANVSIRSFPEHAKVKVTNSEGNLVYEGTTPTMVSLKKYDGYFSGQTYTMTFSKKGYLKYVATDGMKVNGWSWYIEGNLIFGGVIGWFIVDPLTGAMWDVNSHHIDVSLSHSH
ncbi:MAG: hypothetical protein EVJ47_03585 [Candidatus Acidulodesulfobacterium ferriphilum]|uniref:PEGA domain-containing protein n=1 Tax=Candidatus Acidulodesulfobacterium ferriphilum TaxID=2597223 RepID=A0A519BDM7_9DELT|nr:MAG: hypothetical protein EVJ47_03585 [Candidatus Acidulodesulfobacterium ferriphilum]